MLRVSVKLVLIAAVVFSGVWVASPHILAWYHYRAGAKALEQYHSEQARDHFAECLRRWPTSSEVHLLACRAARRHGDYEEAKQHIQEMLRLEARPTDAGSLEWGLLRAAMGDLDEVEGGLDQRAEKEPAQAPLILEALAEGYMRMYRIRDSLICLDRWQQIQPDNPQAFFLRGNLWRQLKGFKRAISEYEQVLQFDAERLDARWWLSLCLVQNGRFNDALAHLELIRIRRPDNDDARVLLARCYGRLDQMEGADKLLDEVLARNPEHVLALKVRGQLLQMVQKPAAAEPWLREALRAMPHDYEANWGLFQSLQKQNKVAEAKAQSLRVEQLKKRLERLDEIGAKDMPNRPHDASLHCELGVLLLGLGHKDLGHRWLLSALHEDSNYRPARAALADYFESQGNSEKAAEYRRRAEGL